MKLSQDGNKKNKIGNVLRERKENHDIERPLYTIGVSVFFGRLETYDVFLLHPDLSVCNTFQQTNLLYRNRAKAVSQAIK